MAEIDTNPVYKPASEKRSGWIAFNEFASRIRGEKGWNPPLAGAIQDKKEPINPIVDSKGEQKRGVVA